MKWKYKGETFISIPHNWNRKFPHGFVKRDSASTEVLVYNPKWDKCFWVSSLRYSGNGNQLKAYIEDVYTGKYCYVEARKLELVVKKTDYLDYI